MARPLRIEYEGAVYHVTSRGNARQRIFLDDEDYQAFLEIVTKIVERFRWICHAYCLMDNHYHLLLETPQPNLSKGMHLLNSIFSQTFNRKHRRVGHVLQGRFKSILVEKESHLLEVARYVVLNPVRAKVVEHPGQHPWSSYRASAGMVQPDAFLSVDWILAQFAPTRSRAHSAYRDFVDGGIGIPLWEGLHAGMLLGSDAFAEHARSLAVQLPNDPDITRAQRYPNQRPLEDIFGACDLDLESRNQMIHEAVVKDGHTMSAVGRWLGLHPATISRIVKQFDRDAKYKV